MYVHQIKILILTISIGVPIGLHSMESTVSPTILLPDQVTIEQVQEKQVTLAWSNHNVLTQADTYARAAACMSVSPKYIYHYLQYYMQKAYAAVTGIKGNHVLAKEEIDRLPAGISGDAHATVLEKHGITDIATFARILAASRSPNYPVIQLISELQRIYPHVTQILASNIGVKVLALLAARLMSVYHCQLYPNILMQGLIVDYAPQIINTSSEHDMPYQTTDIRQTKQEFYQEVQKKFNKSQQSQVVVINHSLDAIKEACKAGCVGIHYKNDQQLKSDLKSIGFTQI